MRNINFIAITLLTACLLVFPGCSGKDYSVAPVSGTVTLDGNPVTKLKVLFSPEPVDGNDSVGPYSSGKTDADGKFSLKTRYDERGAVIGKHTVTFQFTDIGEGAMDDLIEQLHDAEDAGSKEKYQRVQKQIRDLEVKLKGRPSLGANKITVDVPSSGTDDLVIELSNE